MKMRVKIILFIIGLLSLYTTSAQDKLLFSNIGVKEGIQSTVLTMLQDNQGYIWIGTQFGLYRYDGYESISFRNDSTDNKSISSNYIISLFEDSKGILWVATMNGLNALDRSSNTFTRFMHNPSESNSVSSNLITGIIEDSKGIIWVATAGGGLNRYNSATKTFEHHFLKNKLNMKSPLFITNILFDKTGMLWIVTGKARMRPSKESGNIYLFNTQTYEFSQVLPLIDNKILDLQSVTSIFQDFDENIWFGTLGNGLIKKNSITGLFKQIIPPSLKNGDSITSIIQIKSGQLWFGSQYSGLFQLDVNTNKTINYSSRLPELSNLNDDDIASLLVDNTGILWVGTWTEGIKKLDFNTLQFQKHLQRSGQYHSSKQNILHINQDSKGQHYLAAWESGLLQFDLRTDMTKRPANLTSDVVGLARHIFIDDDDMLWIASNEKGLIYYNPVTQQVKSYQYDDKDQFSISNNKVISIIQDSSKNLWVATHGGGLNFFNVKDQSFSHYLHDDKNENSISDNRIGSLFYDKNGMIWLGTIKGLDIFDPMTKQVIAHFEEGKNGQGLFGNDVNCIFQDSKGIFWIGTDKGITRLQQSDKNSYENMNISSDLGFKKSQLGSIGDILEDSNGNLWISSFQYISRYNTQSKILKNYNSTRGVLEGGYYIGSSYKDELGRMYFGGFNGLTVFNTNTEQKSTSPPKIVLTELLLFNKPVPVKIQDDSILKKSIDETAELDFNYKQNVFSIEFSALHYSSSFDNQYAYKLEGFDKEWTYTNSKNRRATYTNLDPGKYSFFIKASNNDGNWSKPLHKLNIHVHAAPWKSNFAFLIYFIITSSIIGSIIWLRIKQIQAIKLRNEQLSLTSKLFENTSECVWLLDNNLNYLAVNQGFSRVTGFSKEETIGKKLSISSIKGQNKNLLNEIFSIIMKGGRWEGEIWAERKNGEIYPIEIVVDKIILNNNNQERQNLQYVGVFSDITQRKKTEENLWNMAYFDKLTQLPNRAYFNKLVNDAIALKSNNNKLLMFYFDLDDFKNINDSLGHTYGDQLLLIITKRLQKFANQSYVIARLGGDEFALMIPKTHILKPINEHAINIATEILNIIRQQVKIKDHTLHVSTSMGISIYPSDGGNYEELLRSADNAMYNSKRKGKNQFTLYSADMNKKARKRLMLEDELNKAIQSSEIIPFYQPKVSLKTGKIEGLEILARWKHDKLGWISPKEFIPIAEDSRLINKISDQLLTQACQFFLPIIERNEFKGRMSFNLSMSQFLQGDIVLRIGNILKKHNIPNHFLEIEITESMVMKNISQAIDKMKQFHRLNITIAIDDFGTGYSSLSHLKKFPIDTLKIDISFIRDLLKSKKDKNIVVSIIQLAHNLGMKVVAEGGETIEQVMALKELKCEYLQGHYFSKAISGSEFIEFMKQNNNILNQL